MDKKPFLKIEIDPYTITWSFLGNIKFPFDNTIYTFENGKWNFERKKDTFIIQTYDPEGVKDIAEWMVWFNKHTLHFKREMLENRENRNNFDMWKKERAEFKDACDFQVYSQEKFKNEKKVIK
jgi:hypothetical protein